MRIEFPDLKGKEKNTLFIIGNGFDLYHGVQSKYRHFRSWLERHNHEDFVDKMERVFPKLTEHSNGLWSNFEEAMKDYNPIDMYRCLHEPTKDIFEPEKWHTMACEEVEKTTMQIRPLMKEWAKTINIENVKPVLELSQECRYLTFNYTKVLEDIYGISKKNVCHIHGCIDDDELIVGFDLKVNPLNHDAPTDEEMCVERGYLEALNKLDKAEEEQINKNRIFFDSLEDISCVIVLGHSMGSIDLAYFREIRDSVQPNCHWHFSKHTVNDEVMHTFIQASQDSCCKNAIQTSNYWIFNF